VQEVGVAVDLLGPREHLQVPDHVTDDEADPDEAGHRHDGLLADLRLPEVADELHRLIP
jgi:hypothetical protein